MKTDIRDTGSSYELDIDLPGFKKDEIKAKVENGYLTISAEKGLDKEKRTKMVLTFVGNVISAQCSRSFYIGEGIEQKDIHAKFEDGILKLSIPKKEQRSWKKTNISLLKAKKPQRARHERKSIAKYSDLVPNKWEIRKLYVNGKPFT